MRRLSGREVSGIIAIIIMLLGVLYLGGCASAPKPVLAPTPTPVPEPTPAVCNPACMPGAVCIARGSETMCVVDPNVCPLQLPLVGYGIGLRIGPHGTPQQRDATPFIRKGDLPFPPPGWTGTCRPNECDVSGEKDPDHGNICTVILCGKNVVFSLEPPEAGTLNWAVGYTAKVTMTAPGHLLGFCSGNPSVKGVVSVP